jgi:uncharacterized protein (TIGR03067 family)
MTISGKWKISAAELGGRQLPASEFDKQILEMDKNSYQVIEDKVVATGTLHRIRGSHPQAMTMKCVYGPNEGKTFQCIYRLEGDGDDLDLLMCYNLGGEDLPHDFKTFDNTLLYLVRYKKVVSKDKG